ncbi:MAG TPA: lipoprotein [Pseudorhodoplanes sp.]|nr:lipoprotein [Pseudorhodoplanes sp.]
MTRLLSLLLAATGALALLLTLSACGRKGSLDPPPGGYRLEPGAVRTPTSRRGATRPQEQSQDYDEDGRPIAPEGPPRSFPLDPLIR